MDEDQVVPSTALDEDDWNIDSGLDDGDDTVAAPEMTDTADDVDTSAVVADDVDDVDAAPVAAVVAEPADTAAVPAATAAAPPQPPMSADEDDETAPLLRGGESKGDVPAAAPPAVPAVASYTSAGAGAGSSSASGKCPIICSPGLERVWGWMTWKETVPGVAMLTAGVAWYALRWSPLQLLVTALMVGILAGGLAKVHNTFMDEQLTVPTVDAEVVAKVIGDHVAVVVAAVVDASLAAARWDSTLGSLTFLAHLWLLTSFSCLFFSPTFLLLALFAAFLGPMCWTMVAPQAIAAYNTSAKPLVNKAVMQLHNVAMKLHGLDKNRMGLVAAGAAVVLFLLWRIFSAMFSFFSLLSFLWTLTSLGLVVAQHSKAFGCPGAAAAVTDGKKKQH